MLLLTIHCNIYARHSQLLCVLNRLYGRRTVDAGHRPLTRTIIEPDYDLLGRPTTFQRATLRIEGVCGVSPRAKSASALAISLVTVPFKFARTMTAMLSSG